MTSPIFDFERAYTSIETIVKNEINNLKEIDDKVSKLVKGTQSFSSAPADAEKKHKESVAVPIISATGLHTQAESKYKESATLPPNPQSEIKSLREDFAGIKENIEAKLAEMEALFKKVLKPSEDRQQSYRDFKEKTLKDISGQEFSIYTKVINGLREEIKKANPGRKKQIAEELGSLKKQIDAERAQLEPKLKMSTQDIRRNKRVSDLSEAPKSDNATRIYELDKLSALIISGIQNASKPEVLEPALKQIFPFSGKFTDVSEDSVIALQSKVQVVNEHHGLFTIKELENFIPTKKMTLNNVTYYCSKVFNIDSRKACIALIEKDGKVYPRFFYLSHSQGVWRDLPYATKRRESPEADAKLTYYGKGLSESDTHLPTALTYALNSLTEVAQKPPKRFDHLIQTGTGVEGKFFNDQMHEFLDKVFYQPFVNYTQQNNRLPDRVQDPKNSHFPKDKDSEQLLPDFSMPFEDHQTLPQYGPVTVRIFPSKDHSLLYMFYEAEDGKAFLANVENVKAEINEYGVRKDVPGMNNMDAPLIDINSQIHANYKPKDPNPPYSASMEYRNNWNTVRALEIIQMYYKALKKDIPGPV